MLFKRNNKFFRERLKEERIRHYEEENSLFKEILELKKENKKLKDELKLRDDYYELYQEGAAWASEAHESRELLKKLIPILECYANSKIGVETMLGTYQFFYYADVVQNTEAAKIMRPKNGACIGVFDPRKAKEGLKLIKDFFAS